MPAADPAVRAGLATLYASFEPLNRELKDLVLRWQVRPVGGVVAPNDHSDESYDRSILDELARLHRSARRLLERAVSLVPELERFLPRLDLAAARVAEDQTEYLSGVQVDSYHMAWWELHTALLHLLGRERGEMDA